MTQGLAQRIKTALGGLEPPEHPVDGACLDWAPRITERLERAGLPAQLAMVTGWVSQADKIIVFVHMATLVEGQVIDYTARQFSPSLPATWVAPVKPYAAMMAVATGVEAVTVRGREPCVRCRRDAGSSYCQICKKVICADCLIDHSHGLDDAFPSRDT